MDDKKKQHEEDALDEALRESFPASDPIAVHASVPSPDQDERKRRRTVRRRRPAAKKKPKTRSKKKAGKKSPARRAPRKKRTRSTR